MYSFIAIQLLLLTKLIISFAKWEDDYTSSIYNFINVSIELGIAVLLGGAFISWASVSTLKANTVTLLSLILAMLVLVMASSMMNGVDLVAAASNLMRTALPLTYLVFLYELMSRQPVATESLCRANKFIALAVIVLTLYGMLFFPNTVNRLEIWWPAFFGGLHDSAYIVFAGFFCVYSAYIFRPGNYFGILLIAYLVCGLLLLIYGWGVRTILLCALVFSYCMFCFRFRLNPSSWLAGALAFVISTGVFLLSIGAINFVDLSRLTSGRLIMYMDKAAQLSSNGVSGWLLGNGYGADLIVSKAWYWGERGAHNDYISLLVENGALFLLVFCYFLYLTYRRITVSHSQKSLFLATLCTSLVSNGYFVRPLGLYLIINALILFGFARNGNFRQLQDKTDN